MTYYVFANAMNNGIKTKLIQMDYYHQKESRYLDTYFMIAININYFQQMFFLFQM